MEIKTLKCPECGANFKSNENVSFCSHCGAKLYFDDGTKNINYNYNYKTEDVAKIRKAEIKKELELDGRQNAKEALVGICIFLIIFIIGFISLFKGMKNKSDLQEEELQSIVNEIYVDIENENYEEALIKTNQLYYTENWSSEIEDKWDNTRESLIKLIEEKMN